MPNFAAQLEDRFQAACQIDDAWETHLESYREDFDYNLARVCRAVRAGDEKKRHELLDKLDVSDVVWEAGLLIAAILQPNATLQSVREVLENNIIAPAVEFYAQKTWEA